MKLPTNPEEESIKLDESYKPNVILLDKEDAEKVYDYFLKRAGYISNEFDQPVLDFIKRLEEFLK